MLGIRQRLIIFGVQVIFLDADTKRSYTFAQVRDTALAFAHWIQSTWDWRKGDVLAVFSPNSIDIPAIMYGVAWTGGVVSPANPTYTVEELTFQLKNAGAKALVTQVPLLPVARAAAKRAGVTAERIIVMGDLRDPEKRVKHFSSIKSSYETARLREEKVDPKRDVAYLVYSSGTTGLPKGVMLSHRNIICNVLQTRAHERGRFTWNGGKDGQGDKVLAFLPFFHVYGKCLG